MLFLTFTHPSNSALPHLLSFLCFLSYFCFLPQPTFEFYCSTHWFSMFFFSVFFFFFTLSLTPFLLDSRLHNLFTSQLNCMASTFRWQQTEFLYQRYWAVYKHDFPHRCVLFICVNVSRSSCQQCLLESCK